MDMSPTMFRTGTLARRALWRFASAFASPGPRWRICERRRRRRRREANGGASELKRAVSFGNGENQKNRGAGADDSGKEDERARSDGTSTRFRAAAAARRPAPPAVSPVPSHRARGLPRHSRVSVHGARADGLVQAEHGSHARLRVERAHEPHLRRARVREARLDAAVRERFHHGLRARGGLRSLHALLDGLLRGGGSEARHGGRARGREGGRDGRTEGGDVARAVFCDATGDARPLQRAREKTKRRPRVVSRRTIGSTALFVQDDGTNRNRRRRRSFVPRGARALSTAPRRAMHVLARALLWQLVLLAVMLRWRARKGARARVGTPAPATAPSSPPPSSRCVDRLERLNGARTALCALPLSPLRRINAQTDFCELGGGAGVSR